MRILIRIVHYTLYVIRLRSVVSAHCWHRCFIIQVHYQWAHIVQRVSLDRGGYPNLLITLHQHCALSIIKLFGSIVARPGRLLRGCDIRQEPGGLRESGSL